MRQSFYLHVTLFLCKDLLLVQQPRININLILCRELSAISYTYTFITVATKQVGSSRNAFDFYL
jgi:hypothetical protein